MQSLVLLSALYRSEPLATGLYGVSLLWSRTGMVSVGNLDESKFFLAFEKLAERFAIAVMNYLGIC